MTKCSTIVVGAEKRKKYLVAAKTCKKGMYECIVYRDHSRCTCPCYRFNSICKHSLCVSEIEGILKEHLDYIAKSPRCSLPSKSGLVEPAKDAQGKKGGVHKNAWRPSRSIAVQKHPFTEIHHNNLRFSSWFPGRPTKRKRLQALQSGIPAESTNRSFRHDFVSPGKMDVPLS
ncbi:hypothetical protein OS493_025624 [Desmophyllum pertusum]|uniref:SWIM-type domain-containing protein n=1 Tax=Desmophyllum pertusum TaxID=174260 RepID=A0A9X0D9A5_9CNID|nr:hypothetical protein OS493_025624 [Desmophyllum pertusum]